MQCPNCEADNREGARFCDECGFPLSGAIARAAGSASPVETTRSLRQEGEERVQLDERAQEGIVEDSARVLPDGYGQLPDAAEMPEFVWSAAQDDAQVQLASEHNAFDLAERQDWSEPAMPEAVGAAVRESHPVPDSHDGSPLGVDDGFGYPEALRVSEGGYPDADRIPSSESTMQMPRVEQSQPPASRDFRISTPSAGSSRRRIMLVVAAGIVAGVAIAALVTYLLGFWGGIPVPDVVGMTESDARATLEKEGFAVRSTQVKSDDTEGLVLVMDPAGGSRAAEDSEVVIHISTARFVPDVTGKTEAEAHALMEGSGYENVSYEKVRSEGEEGIVLSVEPDAGTRAKSNARIVVNVSEAYSVPDVSGLDLASAEQSIADAGLVYGVAYVDTDQYEDGAILGTEPAAGTKVEKDSYVAISVARRRGAELVALTESMLAPGQTVTIGGVDYEIQSLDFASYEGDDTVSFSITALPRTTFFGKTIYADQQVVSGQVAWSEDNEVVSIS